MVLAEIAQGVENKPTPKLRNFLAEVLALPLAEFGEAEALEWGRITSKSIERGPRGRGAGRGYCRYCSRAWLDSGHAEHIRFHSSGRVGVRSLEG